MFFLLWILLIVLQFAAAYLAYYTIGAVMSTFMYVMVILLNLIPLIFYIVKYKRLAYIILTILAAIIIIPQIVFAFRWWQLDYETARIIAYVTELKTETGHYPPNLANYSYQNPRLSQYIGYSIQGDCYGFCLGYHISTPNTSHSYNPQSGWYYIDD